MKIKLDGIVTAVLVICAVVTTGVVLRREFGASSVAPIHADQKPIFIKEWRTLLADGRRMGPAQARVDVLEFADFECPFCGTFHKAITRLQRRYPGEMTVTYVYFPLAGHRFALPAARVAECANDQGRFQAMHDALFEGQDQFGLKPWDDYATAAGVPDIATFDACIKKTDPIPQVEEGKALGAKLDVQGTPTIIINGWKLGHPPSEQELDEMVQRILAGKAAVS